MSSKIKALKYNGKWDFSPSIESLENISIQKEYQLFINGKFQKPLAKKYFPSINPTNEQQLSRIAKADSKDVDLAVNSARSAFNGQWSKISAKERAKYIYRIARIIQEKSKELAIVETLDGGKPIRESRDIDIPLAAAHFFYYAGWADKLNYAFPNRNPKPLGVVGQIIPWNFPLMMAAWKIAPALATGNTVVLKPAESTSITALLLAEIIKEAELPPGVVNIITGDGSTGNLIVNHPDVNKIAFTGSTQVGKSIMENISGTNKRSTMELGGKAANIIFEDAPLDQAVEGVINGIYFNQGHVCCAGSRLFIQESVYDVVLRKLKDRSQSLLVGNPLDKNSVPIDYDNDFICSSLDSNEIISGTGEALEITNLLIYPNPMRANEANGTINYVLNQNSTIKVYIYNMFGQKVFSSYYESGQNGGQINQNSITLPPYILNNLPSGMYLIYITNNGKILGKIKLVIKAS